MISDPNPQDDPEMEKFCEWLYTEGYTHQMELPKLKEVWLRGRVDYYGSRLSSTESFSPTEYELLTYLYRESYKRLEKHCLSPDTINTHGHSKP